MSEMHEYLNNEEFPPEEVPLLLKNIELRMGKSNDVTNRVDKMYKYILGLKNSKLTKAEQLALLDDEACKAILEKEAEETGNFTQFITFCENIKRLKKQAKAEWQNATSNIS
jgi:hypothetical protein